MDKSPLSLQTIQQKLTKKLNYHSDIHKKSTDFSDLKTNHERVNFALKSLKEYDLLPDLIEDTKNNEEANKYRELGNEMFKNKKHLEAIENYTQSVCLSEKNSENLALAYANRSAVLFEKKLYKECLKDIERAFKNNYPKNLQQKLIKRQQNANKFKLTTKSDEYHSALPKIPDDEKSETIQSGAKSITVAENEEMGRHIIATRDIQIGEIIAIEKPFCAIVIAKKLIHCHECLVLCYNTIPCETCTQVVYCNEQCRKSAWNRYHRYECPILKTVNDIKSDTKIIAVKIALSIKNLYPEIGNLSIGENRLYRSDRYNEIHYFVTNTEKRKPSDLFPRAVQAAIYFNLIEKYTDFFNVPVTDRDKEIFSELVLHHIQTCACNFHEITELTEDTNGVFSLNEIGAGAFAYNSLMNHGCNPNIVRTCYGTTIIVRATQFIPKGCQIFDNYGYHYAVMNKKERQQHLTSQYFFECVCDACKEDWPFYNDLKTDDTYKFILNESDFGDLMKGNVETAKKLLKEFLPKAKMKWVIPSKEWCDIEEVIKQCYCILGNRRVF